MKRKGMALCMAVVLVLACAGCQEKKAEPRVGTSENEVLTLKPVPADKTLLTMRSEDGINFQLIEAAIEKQFEGVDIVPVHNTPTWPDIENNNLEDIILTAFSSEEKAALASRMLDLVGEDFTENYQLSVLAGCAHDGKLLYLPGPSNIYGIVYNKEMFAKNGWQVPKSREEFISLCRIISESGIRAIQPSLRYSDSTRQFFGGFTYEELFAGIENYSWLETYRTGGASMKGHIEPGLALMRRFAEEGILQTEDFEVEPRTRSGMMYQEQSCAMILETQMAPVYAQKYGSSISLGMMPFYSSGEQADYLFAVPNFYIGVNAGLAGEENGEKLALVMEILGWLSTVEGQQAIIDPETPLISNVKGVPLESNEFLDEVADTVEKGHVVPEVYLAGTMGTDADKAFRNSLCAYLKGEMSEEELIAECDRTRDQVLAGDTGASYSKIGTVEKDFTVLETSLYFAQLFKVEMGADIGLCMSNTRRNGNNLRLYAGDLLAGGDNTATAYLNNCFFSRQSGEGGDRKIYKVSMTGRQLLDALNNPPEDDLYTNCYMVAAGLNIEFAPWAGVGNRYVSVKLANGSELETEKSYTAAELFARDVRETGTIAPFADGRFTLNWEMTE